MNRSLVVTTINAPNQVLRELSAGAQGSGTHFIVIGDTKSPADFSLLGAQFLSIEEQLRTGFLYAKACPTRHYARKNIGYLKAIRDGATSILETDDDNFPRAAFFGERNETVHLPVVSNGGWVNVYRYFSTAHIWPRGFPLEHIQAPLPPVNESRTVCCPIQQGLADKNPDVDALYRLLLPLPQSFQSGKVALGPGSWCPFNSQNTVWFPRAYPLLYLPAFCSFRMTDIWRSLVAQRISHEYGWHLYFGEASVFQERNEHNLLKDFEDEVPGYLMNAKIRRALEQTVLDPSESSIFENLKRCWQSLVDLGAVKKDEMNLLNLWTNDLSPLI